MFSLVAHRSLPQELIFFIGWFHTIFYFLLLHKDDKFEEIELYNY